MPSYLTTGSASPVPQPSFHDFELAIRMLSGGKLRPAEGNLAANPTPELTEALHRVQHTMRSEIAAARACLLALTPEAVQAMGDLLTSSKESIKLGAFRAWAAVALPPQTQEIKHTIDPEAAAIAGQAAADFHRLTEELVTKLEGFHTIDVTQSKHVFRGTQAKPVPGLLEKPEGMDDL